MLFYFYVLFYNLVIQKCIKLGYYLFNITELRIKSII